MGEDDFQEMAYYQHITPFKISKRNNILSASTDIEDSFSGEINALRLHRFFIESSVEIRNAVRLLEQGFIGAAFYSVRSAVELSRVVTFLTTKVDPVESEIFSAWRSGANFPMDGKIKQEIRAAGGVYEELIQIMPDFFEGQRLRLSEMQKYIHKQGFKTFYYRGLMMPEKEKLRNEKIVNDFEEFVLNSLIEIALLRLCIDPFPLLLVDPDVKNRIHFESMTYPFSDKLLRIMGTDIIDSYKSTDFYRSFVDYFSGNVELSDESMMLINDSYYDRKKWETIRNELEYLPLSDRVAVLVFNANNKVSRIYGYGGFEVYISDTPTKRQKFSWDGRHFEAVKSANVTYDEVFLSYIVVDGKELWLEHNTKFTKSEITILEQVTQQPEKSRPTQG